MANLFESYERRIDHINEVLAQYGIKSIEEAKAICDAKGIDPYKMCEAAENTMICRTEPSQKSGSNPLKMRGKCWVLCAS